MSKDDTTEEGRMWAALSYASFFVGLPLGAIPLIQKEDPFAVYHAKHATAVWLAFVVAYITVFAMAFVLFFCTFGLSHIVFIPLLMLMMLWPIGTGVHGLILSINGEWKEPIGAFGLGDKIFSGFDVDAIADAQRANNEGADDPTEEPDAEEPPPPPPPEPSGEA